MPTKLQLYSQIADSQTREITNSRENWTSFLNTVGRLYKYPYAEQLMIYAQRPDAVACASLETWNKSMNRFIRKGAKGIALIDQSGDHPRLRYVFDYADTVDGRYNAKKPFVWEMKPEHEDSVIEAIDKAYETDSFMNANYTGYQVGNIIFGLANELSVRYYNDNRNDIGYSVADSFLEDYDEYNISVAFRESLTVSVAYCIMTRCGIDPSDYIDDEDFQPIFDFNTPQTVNMLGEATSAISQEVLREIEVTIKKYERERSKTNERTDIQQGRGLSDTRYSDTGHPTSEQIWNDAEIISQRTPEDSIQSTGVDGETVFPLSGDRADSDRETGTNDERPPEAVTAAGQSNQPDGLDSTYEQPERTSGGIYSERADIQLDNQEDGAEETAAPFSLREDLEHTGISLNTVDAMLRDGGNRDNSVLRITAHYMKGKTPAENAEFLAEEYKRGGKGLKIDGERFSMWFDTSGITFAEGATALHALRSVTLSWEQIESRVRELLYTGQYLTQSELNKAESFECKELANKIWYLHQDTDNDYEFFLDNDVFRRGFPDSTQRIAEMLSQSDQLENIIDGLNTYCTVYEQNPSILRFRGIHNPQELLQRLSDLRTPSVTFTANEIPTVSRMAFVTEDDIEKALSAGSNVENSKFRIYSYFLNEDNSKEKADFLKNEYGTGSGNLGIFRADNSYVWHDAKGISISRGSISNPDDKVVISWSRAARVIDDLINIGNYMTQNEIDRLPVYERQILGSEIMNFFSNLPEDIQRPIAIDNSLRADYWGEARRIGNLLDNPETVSEILNTMRPVMDNTPTADRYHMSRKTAFDNLTAFENGTFTLFARHEAVPESPIQMSFFPTESEQITEIRQTEQLTIASIPVTVTQEDIDNALIDWNGDPASVQRVAEYMAVNSRSRGAATFLQNEYGKSEFVVTKDGADPLTLLWHKVQRGIAQLIEAGRFMMDNPERVPESITKPERVPETEPTSNSIIETEPNIIQQERYNFRITDDHLGEGGAKLKAVYNINAIHTLKQIEAENRFATPEEQQTLSRYVGWGGIPQIFDADNPSWKDGYNTLLELLTPDEYDMARASTLNAHYTSPTVIKAMYETLERMGVRDGNFLEPSCGIGNFFGLIPDSMAKAKLYGVELDSITGRIAKQLYPNADIKITGFEKTNMPDAFFDVAVGNVPFGSYKLADKRYDKQNFLIHDYFFAKALDQVRPGGIVAFITSKGTLDKQNIEVRKYLAQRAELLGAVRLPNTAFKANAGTDVTSDIIFLQKRDRFIDIQPDWVNCGKIFPAGHNDDGIQLNRYFVDNPHMMLGKMTTESTQYGHDTTCQPIEGADLGEQLREALSHIQGQITEIELDDIEGIQDVSIPADPSVRNFSYTIVDDTVYFRENSRMNPVDMPATTLERVKGMVALRDCVRELIDYQLHDYSDYDIQSKQAELNTLYDSFTLMFGLINDNANNRAFSADSAYYLLCSLEVIDEDGKLERKSDMFTKRTIKQKVDITSVDTSAEALAVSIAKKAQVDMNYMKELTGFPEEKIISDLTGVIFRNPLYNYGSSREKDFVTADEYLSGNVREKLEWAKRSAELYPDDYSSNVKALEQAQPKDLDASEISVRLGTTWIDKQYIRDFMFDLLQPSRYLKYELAVNYSQHTGEWNIAGKSKVSYNDVLANVTYGTSRATAYKIIEETLNLKDIRIYDTKIVDGRETRVLNKQETTLAQQKQEAIKQAFKDWIFRDPERRQTLVKQYNEQFNSIRPREYDGSHIEFTGISPEITLAQHQKDAVARILYGGNTLLAHEVGAGKTFEMVGAAMESKRLGLCTKSLVAVPNHLTEQMASEFLRLYPSANILVATKKDFETKNRKKFCAKIATGDYDAVIIGHSQLEKIPLSRERQERLLNEQIDEITYGIQELKDNNGERFTIKQLEKTKKSLEARLEKLSNDSRKDDVVTFEQLGVDRLFVDESHAFKNLFLYTKMRNVAGLSTSEAQKSSDMFMKCRYIDEITGNKGVIFATGTPVTNSIAEMYTVQRYLQYDTLKDKNLAHFDCWASTFGETQTSIELSPEGSGYRARTRFAKFTNLPELMSMFKEVADIKTADTLNLPRPKANFHTVVAKPSDIQKAMVKDLSKRAKEVHRKSVDPSVDNMLKITSDGRKIGLDQRLMNPMLPDDETSKVNACMNNIFRIWEETSDKKSTQICFCDFSTPNADGRFNVYDDLKAKLIAKGIPEHEVAFIHDANTETQKKELFAKVRKGQVRVLFGSTFKCGAGTNIQDRLIALHDLDCPWRPADLAQRAGRIVRRGNDNAEVDIFRYCTEATFDSYLFQTVEKKQQFISQIMTSKSPVRSCDDVDEDSLSYAEIKALCAGNPLIKEKMQLDIEVAKLKLLKSDHQSQQYRLQDALLTDFPKRIEASKSHIESFKADISRLEVNTHKGEEGISPMTIGDKAYTDRGQAGAALLEACKGIRSTEPTKIGSYRGFDMLISFDSINKEFKADMKGSMTHSAILGDDSFGNITRITNAFDKIPQRLEAVEVQLQTLYEQVENAKAELDKPFSLEQEFTDKSARLAELDAQLNMDEQGDTAQEIEAIAAKSEPISAKAKPSILETLKQNTEKSRQIFGGKSESEKTSEVSI